MSKHLFRGVSVKTGTFVYGSLIVGNNNKYILTEEEKSYMVVSENGHSSLNLEQIIDGSESKFIGIQDKNGKDIYQNDLIKLEDDGPVFTVVWKMNMLTYALVRKEDMLGSYVMSYKDDLEVVGNVFEQN